MDLTFAQVEAEVRRIVAADPEHVYRLGGPIVVEETDVTCFYSTETPGAVERCIFGLALHNLGVDEEFLRNMEGQPVQALLRDLGAGLTDHQVEWTSILQSAQDNSLSWIAALIRADVGRPLR